MVHLSHFSLAASDLTHIVWYTGAQVHLGNQLFSATIYYLLTCNRRGPLSDAWLRGPGHRLTDTLDHSRDLRRGYRLVRNVSVFDLTYKLFRSPSESLYCRILSSI